MARLVFWKQDGRVAPVDAGDAGGWRPPNPERVIAGRRFFNRRRDEVTRARLYKAEELEAERQERMRSEIETGLAERREQLARHAQAGLEPALPSAEAALRHPPRTGPSYWEQISLVNRGGMGDGRDQRSAFFGTNVQRG